MKTATLALGILLVTVACPGKMKKEQLENVAKDWCLTVRASQVIPVYPLSEDLQPGDVLLVSTPIEQQVELYEEKGFLPLDQHFVRLVSSQLAGQYRDFYDDRYGLEDGVPPAPWQEEDDDGLHFWELAPAAAFPSYSFRVSASSGMNLAIPIQGVPFALGLMNSGAASGSVTIADAHTFGLDIVRLEKLMRDWATDNRALLRPYHPSVGEDGEVQRHYLRVVSRVYVTGRVNVTVKNDESFGGQAGAGATKDKGVVLKGLEQGATSKNFLEAISALNRVAEDQLPGADVKVATASSRSVTLNETFPRPMVIGYVGFDLPILTGGRLGPPISTLSQLDGRPTLPVSNSAITYRLAALSHMSEALANIHGSEADRIREALDSMDIELPETYPFGLYEWSAPGVMAERWAADVTPVTGAGFDRVLDYLGLADTTVTTLTEYLEGQPDDSAVREQQREAAREARDEVAGQLAGQPALMDAIDFVFLQ